MGDINTKIETMVKKSKDIESQTGRMMKTFKNTLQHKRARLRTLL
eukprot:UN21849